jgi:hypothetical protein
MPKSRTLPRYLHPTKTYGGILPHSDTLLNIAVLDKNLKGDQEAKKASDAEKKRQQNAKKAGYQYRFGEMILSKKAVHLFAAGDKTIPAKWLPLGISQQERENIDIEALRPLVRRSKTWRDLALYVFEKAVNQINGVDDGKHPASWNQLARERSLLAKRLLKL